MPLGELSILNHVTLTEAVNEFKYGPQTALVDFYCPGPAAKTDGGDSFEYDILKADRGLAAPKSPDTPTKPVALTAVGYKRGRCIHVGEHKKISGDTLANLRKPGTREKNAQERVSHELRSLNRRGARLRNWGVGQMLTGTLAIDEDDVKVSVDYEIPAANTTAAGATWATVGTDIPAHLDGWIEGVEQESGYTPLHVRCSRTVMRYLMANTKVKDFLGSSDYKAQVGKLGYIRDFHGLVWHVDNTGYKPNGGSFTRYVNESYISMTPEPDGEWCGLIEGSTEILPLGGTDLVEVFGRHGWVELKSNPAGYILCAGDTFIPALKIPAAVVYTQVVL